MTKPDSTFTRLLFVGDSVTWGGVLTDQSDTIPAEAERSLEGQCYNPIEALNASAGSWGIGNARAYIEKYGLFESDVIVLQIGTHDLTQPKSTSDVVGRHPSFPNENPTLAIEELATRYLWPRLRSYLSHLGRGQGGGQSGDTDAISEGHLAQNLDHLREMVGRIQSEQIPVVILHTPNRNEVAGPSVSDASPYRQQFLHVTDSMRVPVLNLARDWPEGPPPGVLYRDYVHLNERGNAVVADTLQHFLMRNVPDLCDDGKKREES
ncbi:SGNH/GDSL hydrolase family protein [Salinibacter sp.]|uniref:SGNH/GDSL hydrolase family protein n=1 Tax=Salinibacter sp. TaxID=2065818 RepID=UPI003D75B1A1